MSSAAEPISIATPELRDGMICLRSWSAVDTEHLHAAAQESMATVGRWLPWCHPGYGLADASAWIEHCRQGWLSRSYFSLAICDESSSQLVGGIGLNHLNRLHRSANMGYWIRHSRQGHGLTTRAGAMMARFGFETLGLIRIEIITEPDNTPSRRVAEKLGAQFEVIARHRLWVRDEAKDAAVYALLPEDLRSLTG